MPTLLSEAEGNMTDSATQVISESPAVGDPMHVQKFLVRNLGGPISV